MGLGLALGLGPSEVRAQSLIPGIDEWAQASTKDSAPKWGGSRVPFPTPTPRPELPARLDSVLWPLSVHTSEAAPWPRAKRVLRALEGAYTALHETGWTSSFGDGGQGGTAGHDVYLVPIEAHGDAHEQNNLGPSVRAAIDATEPLWALDAARAFVLLDPRLPESRLEACALQGLAESMLFELDPAEADSLRQSSAAYLTYLVTGEFGCEPEQHELRRRTPERAPLGPESGAGGASWLWRLGKRQDAGTGVFLRDMWQFARQRTWEGSGLRASPDLFEAIAATLSAEHVLLENLASDIADEEALATLQEARALGEASIKKLPWSRLAWSKLPRVVMPPELIEPLGSAHVLVEIDAQLADSDRVRVWSRGDWAARWGLSVTTLDSDSQVLTRMTAPARKTPDSYLSVTLPQGTRSILISVTNLADGTPDADVGAPFEEASVALTIDRGGAALDAADLESALF